MEQVTSDRNTEPNNIAITVLRWIAFLPAGLVGSMIVFPLSKLIATWSIGSVVGTSPEDMWLLPWLGWYFGVEIVPSILFGVAFVYCGCYTAPAYKRVIAGVLAGIVLLLTGFAISAPYMTGEWANFHLVLISTAGSIGMAVKVILDDSIVS